VISLRVTEGVGAFQGTAVDAVGVCARADSNRANRHNVTAVDARRRRDGVDMGISVLRGDVTIMVGDRRCCGTSIQTQYALARC
jgi:hypothetical protein